jgi:hypothetical protein
MSFWEEIEDEPPVKTTPIDHGTHISIENASPNAKKTLFSGILESSARFELDDLFNDDCLIGPYSHASTPHNTSPPTYSARSTSNSPPQ